MGELWSRRRLEIITLLVFILLVMASLSILYTSYINYSELQIIDSHKAFVHKIIMFISAFVLFLSLLIVVLKRDYFFMQIDNSSAGLENLLEEIKHSSNTQKINQFKEMLKEKNHTEVYGLISKMIKELQERTQQADEANEAKTLFLSNISHELRTPINGILGFSKILSASKLDEEQRDFVETISKSSEELLGVVNNILDVAQTQSGQIEIENNYFSIVEVFENLAHLYAVEASKKGVVAIKFEVTDTGIGISDEQQKRVFSAFTQADNSNTREFSGAGLGLTLAHSWVNLLDGELILESLEGKGTTVLFTLNLAQQELSQNEKVKGVKVGLYAPLELQKEKSHDHVTAYLSRVRGVTLESFESVVACKEAESSSFNILYLHYDQINKEELQRIVAQYSSEIPLVLVTKLENRFKIQDIAPAFSQIIYKPITFSKMKNSIKIALQNKELLTAPSSIEKMFNLKALVVEDNRVNQKVIVHTLKNLGIECDTAENGKEAINYGSMNLYNLN